MKLRHFSWSFLSWLSFLINTLVIRSTVNAFNSNSPTFQFYCVYSSPILTINFFSSKNDSQQSIANWLNICLFSSNYVFYQLLVLATCKTLNLRVNPFTPPSLPLSFCSLNCLSKKTSRKLFEHHKAKWLVFYVREISRKSQQTSIIVNDVLIFESVKAVAKIESLRVVQLLQIVESTNE